MLEVEGYRARLRVRLRKRLHSEAISRLLEVGGREVTVRPQAANTAFHGDDWLVFHAGGFSSEDEARGFGERLSMVVELTGLSLMSGVDVGGNRPALWMNEDWARSLGIIEPHERMFPNVHGLSVVPDSDHVRFPVAQINAHVHEVADLFFDTLTEIGQSLPQRLSGCAEGIRILNAALLSTHPLAQVALAISAVEALGQNEDWSEGQRNLLNALAEQVGAGSELSSKECEEIVGALRRGTHKIGLRQGVLRILRELNLSELRKEWDRIYGLRSGLFHGTSPFNEAETNVLAADAIRLCGRIIMTVAQREGIKPPAVFVGRYGG